MDDLDLHRWAMANLSDPELRDVARGILRMIADKGRDDAMVVLCRQLAEAHPASMEFWTAYSRAVEAFRRKS